MARPQMSDLAETAEEVLTREFEVGAYYEHPGEPRVLWQRRNGYFYTLSNRLRYDTDRVNDWRAGLRRVTFPSEQEQRFDGGKEADQ